MVVVPRIPWKRIFRDVWKQIVFIVIYILIIAWLDERHAIAGIAIPLPITTIPATLLSLLLAFRTNSAYDRWWEARKIWGSIVNDSRTWVRQIQLYLPSIERDELQMFAYRQIAWNYALTYSLREIDPMMYVKDFLSEKDLDRLQSSKNIPNTILSFQNDDLKLISEKHRISPMYMIKLEDTLRRFTDYMGMCERIKKTVFPAMYTQVVDVLIYVSIILLPFALLRDLGWTLIPTTITISFALVLIDGIAIYMQDPFENRSQDTPMLTISKTIEVNLRQQLGEEDLPELPKPVHGVLM